jgi:hypothetical protein
MLSRPAKRNTISPTPHREMTKVRESFETRARK